MGRLCEGAHEISGIKAPLFLCGGVGVVGCWLVGWGCWLVVWRWWCGSGGGVGEIWGAWCAGEISTFGKNLTI